jgi:exosortase A
VTAPTQSSPPPGLTRPAETDATALRARAWHWHGLALAVVLLVIAGLYRDTLVAMVGIWLRSDTYAHALVVPPISLWLIWRQRAALMATTPRAVPALAVVLAVLALVWGLGQLVATNAVTQAMLVALFVAAVPAVLGWAPSRVIMFPLGFLFFSVPVGDFLTPWLMQYTADFTIAALRLSGVPVYREGLQFVIPSGHWSVVEACSGIRYLMASLMAGTLFAYLNYRSHTRRWIFVGVSIGVPIVANWLRAYMIVMLGHLSDNRIATGVDHLLYGWLFFGVVIMLMFFVGARWSEPEAAPAGATGGAAGGPTGSPGFLPARLAAACVAVLAVVAVPPLGTAMLASPGAARAVPLSLPERLAGGVQAVADRLPDWQPRFTEANASDRRVYAGPDGAVGLYLAWYEQQNERRKLVSSENMLVHSEDLQWNQLGKARAQAQLPQGPLVLRAATLSGPPDLRAGARPRLRAWRVYWIDGRFIAADWQAKLAQARQVLAGGGDGGAALVLYTLDDGTGAADARLNAFLQAQAPQLDSLLRALRTR